MRNRVWKTQRNRRRCNSGGALKNRFGAQSHLTRRLVLDLTVRRLRALVRFGRVTVSFFGVLRRGVFVTLLVLGGGGAMRFGSAFMMLGGFGMCGFRHNISPVEHNNQCI